MILPVILKNGRKTIYISAAEITGFCVLALSSVLFIYSLQAAVILLIAFILFCCAAPFLRGVSFFLTIINRGCCRKNAVAITFDDGPDPVSTPKILSLLQRHNVKATFFVIGKNAQKFPALVQQIIEKGHSIGNHSYSHDYLAVFKGTATLKKEILTTQNILKKHGVNPLAYRPPSGITYPGLGKILYQSGMYAVNFSCRAYDGGNKYIHNLSMRILKQVQADDIVVLHDSQPKSPSLLPVWENELEMILTGIRMKGLHFLPLAELINRPVMEIIHSPEKKTSRSF